MHKRFTKLLNPAMVKITELIKTFTSDTLYTVYTVEHITQHTYNFNPRHIYLIYHSQSSAVPNYKINYGWGN